MKFHIIVFLLFCAGNLAAQNNIESILRSIEKNNKELQASEQLTLSKKLEAATENTLPDPNVSYERKWGKPASIGKTGELSVSQSFDFPSVYVHKNQLYDLKSDLYDQQKQIIRQQVLLNAKTICLDLVSLFQQQKLLSLRLQNVQKLSVLYQKRLSTGDANILETNKIELELYNIKTQMRLIETERNNKLKELQTLNGNLPIGEELTDYSPVDFPENFEIYSQEAIAADPELRSLENELKVARKNISLSKSLWFPKFEIGYIREMEPTDKYNGISFGISIPLFENRNKIKQAKALSGYTQMQIENTRLQSLSTLRQLYDQATNLKVSMQEYNKLLQSQKTLSLLNKALENGQLSMIEYFIEANQVYESMQNYLQLENQYQQIVSQMYRYKL